MEEREKMPFHMVITDNETGEVLKELDACAIIGAAQTYMDETCAISVVKCRRLELAATIAGAQKAIDNSIHNSPQAGTIATIMGLFHKAENEVES